MTLPADGAPVTNQRASGRCWLFAATNIFRLALMRRHNLREFELSQAYLFFWDKLEKANFFLEQALDTAAEPLDGQLLRALMASPVGDGGQWDMVANLVDKYGLVRLPVAALLHLRHCGGEYLGEKLHEVLTRCLQVPQALYPDAFSAANSGGMDQLLTTRLRVDALALRALAQRATTAASELAAAKDAMLRDIFRILALTLGPPPFPSETFTWEYHDRDNHFHSVHTTPLDFAAELDSAATLRANRGVRVRRLFSLVHDPRHAPLRLLTVARLGNVVEGRPVTYVNVGLPTLKRACVAQLRAGLPVFFGSDVGKYLDREHGVMDLGVVDYEVAFGVEVGSMAMDKTQRLGVGESAMTHAMVLTGVHVEPASEADVRSGRAEKGGERTVRWRVENSWGASTGDKGYYVMADGWMDQFVYQAVVDPRFVEQEVQDVLKQEPLVLPLWDPMGALA